MQLRRVWDGNGVGHSQLFHIETFSVVRSGKTTCIDDASLAYTNTHHNWDDLAEADADDVHYQLEFEYDVEISDVSVMLVAIEEGSTLFEEPLLPTGSPTRCETCPGLTDLIITELMLENVATYPDESGEFEPWIELYNGSSVDIDLSGYTLSNDLGERGRWALPAVTIPGRQTLVIFADGDANDGPLHTNFRLSPNGGELVLTRPDGMTDGGFVFGSMPPDASLAFDLSHGYVPTLEPTPNEAQLSR